MSDLDSLIKNWIELIRGNATRLLEETIAKEKADIEKLEDDLALIQEPDQLKNSLTQLEGRVAKLRTEKSELAQQFARKKADAAEREKREVTECLKRCERMLQSRQAQRYHVILEDAESFLKMSLVHTTMAQLANVLKENQNAEGYRSKLNRKIRSACEESAKNAGFQDEIKVLREEEAKLNAEIEDICKNLEIRHQLESDVIKKVANLEASKMGVLNDDVMTPLIESRMIEQKWKLPNDVLKEVRHG